jgi:hypothetical protein
MSGMLPHPDHDAVLAGVKATPFGRATAGLDTGRGRRPIAASGSTPTTKIHQFQVSTVSGDCRFHLAP